jgi:hypothetical protein
MARARNIKPALFKNEILGVADPMLTLLFEGLWLLADREGRLEDRPLRIKGELFPYRDGLNIDEMLNWLDASGFIIRYSVDVKRFIQVENFTKHQNPHKNEAPSEIPLASMGCTTSDKIGTSPELIGSAPADSLSLDSRFLIPDSLTTSPAPVAVDEGGTDLFARFWELYPNKKGKAAAEKAWNKLAVTDSLYSVIVKGLASYCTSREWLKDDGQFIPHPATWLNGKRWEDEVKTVSNVVKINRHTGFDQTDYSEGLDAREDGTHGF